MVLGHINLALVAPNLQITHRESFAGTQCEDTKVSVRGKFETKTTILLKCIGALYSVGPPKENTNLCMQ